MPDIITEEALVQQFEKQTEDLRQRYAPQMEALHHDSMLSKVRAITAYDEYALGKQLEQWDMYKAMCEADGSVSDLGTIPRVAQDVITIAYGTSVAPLIASVQPIGEEHGIVYYKEVVAQYGRGNVTTGDTLVNVDQGMQHVPSGFTAGYIEDEAIGVTVSGTTAYTNASTGCSTIDNTAIRPNTVTIEVALTAGTLSLTDDGDGNLIGVGISAGTVTYATGAWTLTLSSDPGEAVAITASYEQMMETATNLPSIQYQLATKNIRARVYALRGTLGLFKSFGLRKRFGLVAEDELAIDLTNEINAEVAAQLITKLYANAVSEESWSKVPPTGISYTEHKETFKDTLADCETNLLTNSGRGVITTIIAGAGACAVISTLPGFVKQFDGANIAGPHLFGTLDGISVIRCPSTVGALSSLRGLILYKGPSVFEAPAVYAPYMPLVVTSTIGVTGNNPLMSQRAAALWAGVDVLVNRFATKFVVTT